MVTVAIMGHGVVGAGVAEILTSAKDVLSIRTGQEIKLTHILDIKPIPDAPEGVAVTNRFEDLLSEGGPDIIVETMGGVGAARDFAERALNAGKHVVTSNKALVVAHGQLLTEIARQRQVAFLYEASVGGGIPIIRPLNDSLAANRFRSVTGIVNGTSNYILSRMAGQGISFPAALGEAKAKGYAEFDPTDDIEGYDSRRKITILAHNAFGADMGDDTRVSTVGITQINSHDMICAQMLGGKIKLVAHAERFDQGWTGWVGPTFVNAGHPLYAVEGVFNAILVNGDSVDDVMFYGRGAGRMPTASAVVSDILDIARHGFGAQYARQMQAGHAYIPPSGVGGRTLMRMQAPDIRAAMEAAEQRMTGIELKPLPVEGQCALVAPKMPMDALDAATDDLKGQGISFGVKMRMLE